MSLRPWIGTLAWISLAIVGLLAGIALVLVILHSSHPRKSHHVAITPAKCHGPVAPIKTVCPNPAKILKIEMFARRLPDPQTKNAKIDLFGVLVKNVGNKNYVRGILFAGTGPFAQPVILDGTTPNLKFVTAKPPVWQVPLAPLKTKVIYFVARSTRYKNYCVGINDAVWQCTS